MKTTTAIALMMNAWTKVEAAVKAQFPKATEEEIYQTVAAVMHAQLGL